MDSDSAEQDSRRQTRMKPWICHDTAAKVHGQHTWFLPADASRRLRSLSYLHLSLVLPTILPFLLLLLCLLVAPLQEAEDIKGMNSNGAITDE